jgi:hypothetical protein
MPAVRVDAFAVLPKSRGAGLAWDYLPGAETAAKKA